MTVRLSKRYGFSASHRLHSSKMSEAENRATYGKCANPFGHGHNYEIEITLLGPVDPATGRVANLAVLDRLVRAQVLDAFGYKDLNAEVAAFESLVPTTENLALEADRRLRAAWPDAFGSRGAALEKVRIWETPRNICEVTDAS